MYKIVVSSFISGIFLRFFCDFSAIWKTILASDAAACAFDTRRQMRLGISRRLGWSEQASSDGKAIVCRG
jgi:hypothetical protein